MQMLRKLVLCVLFIAVASPVLAEDVIRVDCDAGQTITKALKKVKPGTTIRVKGACHETVTITTDRLTLDGQGAAVLDGGGGGQAGFTLEGVITIDGARDVAITGFTVQNGTADGITGRRGAAFTVQDTVVQDNADDGIQVGEFATAELIDCTVRRNGELGILVVFGSNALFRGDIVSSENGIHGIDISNASNATFVEGIVEANNNGMNGIVVLLSSSATLSSQGHAVTANGNGRNGIVLSTGGSAVATGGMISTANNARNGLFVVGGSTLTIFPGTTVSLSHNDQGLNVASASQVTAFGTAGTPLSIENNATAGVLVNASTVSLSGATIENNGPPDATLAFGARATLSGSVIGSTIACDGTELIQGAMCFP